MPIHECHIPHHTLAPCTSTHFEVSPLGIYLPSAHAQQGYNSLFVCVCVCLSVSVLYTTLAAIAFVHSPKLSYHRVIYHDFLDFN